MINIVRNKTTKVVPFFGSNYTFVNGILYSNDVKIPLIKDTEYEIIPVISVPEDIKGNYYTYSDTGVWELTDFGVSSLEEMNQLKINSAREEKQQNINLLFASQMSELKGYITQEEVDTFLIQEEEAKAYQEDNTTSIPFITDLAEARGITIEILIPKIIAKSDAYRSAVAAYMGNKHRLEDLLEDAETLEDINNIIVE